MMIKHKGTSFPPYYDLHLNETDYQKGKKVAFYASVVYCIWK